MNNRELATRIYEALKENGAELGSISIAIIEMVLNDSDQIKNETGEHFE